MSVSPFQSKDRQLNRFNDETIEALRVLSDRASKRSRVGTFDALPSDSDGEAGDVFHVLSGGEWKHDGLVWRPVVDGVMCRRPPLAAQWTPMNAPTLFLDNAGGIDMAGPAGSGTANRHGGSVALTCNVTTGCLEVGFRSVFNDNSGAARTFGYGVAAWDAVNDEFAVAQYLVTLNSTPAAPILKLQLGYGSAGSASPMAGAALAGGTARVIDVQQRYLRLRFESANLRADVSTNKFDWYQFDTQALATVFPTAGRPTRVVAFHVNGGNVNPNVRLFHFDQLEHFEQATAP